MSINLVKMIENRVVSPNNATNYFVKYLKENGVNIINSSGSRNYALINSKLYCITITGANEDKINCRQFSKDGIISFSEKNGKVYLLNKEDLLIQNNNTRELNQNEYKQASSKCKIRRMKPTNVITQLSTKEYKKTYLRLADNILRDKLENIKESLK